MKVQKKKVAGEAIVAIGRSVASNCHGHHLVLDWIEPLT